MKINEKQKLITCITPKGKALPIAALLYEEKGINTVNVNSGRGGGRRGRIEVDVLTVVVSEKQADEIFEFIFYKAEVNKIHGGFMYQGSLKGAIPFILPEVPPAPQ